MANNKKGEAVASPSRLIVAACSQQRQAESQGGSDVAVLRQIYSVLWKRGQTGWEIEDTFTCRTPADYWLWVSASQSSREVTYFVARGLFHFSILTEFWEEIRSKRFMMKVGNCSPGINASNGKRGKGDWSAKVVLEDHVCFWQTINSSGRTDFVEHANYFGGDFGELASSYNVNLGTGGKLFVSDEDDFAGLRKECQVIFESLTELLDHCRETSVADYSPTIGGMSFSSWKKSLQSHVVKWHEVEEVRELEREAFFGGRCDAFFIGNITEGGKLPNYELQLDADKLNNIIEGPAYLLDIRSAYPYVMASELMPCQYVRSKPQLEVEELQNLMDDYCVIARVRVGGVSAIYPKRLKSGVAYLPGDYWTSLCGPELALAISRGHVKEVGLTACYKPGNPFGHFVSYWWGERKSALSRGNEPKARLCKVILDSLYGKLAQMTGGWVNVEGIMPPTDWGVFTVNDCKDNSTKRYRALGEFVQEQQPRSERKWSTPMISAYITSHVRAFFSSLMESLPERSIYYHDTDSLLVSIESLNRLVEMNLLAEDDLGKFRVESLCKQVSIFGRRDLIIDGTLVKSGLKSGATKTGYRSWQQNVVDGPKSIMVAGKRTLLRYRRVNFRQPDHERKLLPGPDGWVLPQPLGLGDD